MAKEIQCPACDAEILLEGSEKEGDTVFCVYCSAPYKVTRQADDDGEAELEEDY